MMPTLVIMAAGMGSRYGGLKQIDPIGPNGEVIMDYSIYDAIKAGFDKVVFIIKKENEGIFRDKIGSRYENKIAVEYVFQSLDFVPNGFVVPSGRQKPWGTGHAVLSCKDAVKAPFAVINADDFYGRETFSLLSDFLQKNKEPYKYAMSGFFIENTVTDKGSVSRGVCEIDENNYLRSVVERSVIEIVDGKIMYNDEADQRFELPKNTIVSMNTWAFKPTIFSELENKFTALLENKDANLEKCEFYLPNAVDEMIKDKKATVTVLFSDEKWYGVTHKEDKNGIVKAINDMVLNGRYPQLC